MASTSTDNGELTHAGPAISPQYFPEYAAGPPPVTTLYSTPLYLGSVIILLAMSMLGLPLVAFAYWEAGSVSLALAIGSTVATVIVFLIGLAICMHAFRKYASPEGH